MRPIDEQIDAVCEQCGKMVIAIPTCDFPDLYWIFDRELESSMEHECIQPRHLFSAIRGVEWYRWLETDQGAPIGEARTTTQGR